MIGHLKGKVIHSDLKSLILDVNGVGYKIFTNTAVLNDNREVEVEFWTYLAVRENALDLYGFTHKEELDFFELLLTVSGIGPKSAINILSIASVKQLHQAIVDGDTGHLTKVSGIGKKVAEKIVLELKDKINDWGQILNVGVESKTSNSHDLDALEALKALGYTERDAREALKKALGESTEEKIKSALKNLNF
jgi:Holliday junction DNA helicase RuvA